MWNRPTRFLTPFLCCAAFFYPTYWLAMLVVYSGPSLIKLGPADPRLRAFQVSPAFAGPMLVVFDPLLTSTVVAGAGVLGLIVLRQYRMVAGLWMCALAVVAMRAPLRPAAPNVVALTFDVAVLLSGLWLMVAHRAARAYGWRSVAAGAAASVLLAAATHGGNLALRHARIARYQADRARTMASVPEPDPHAPYAARFFQKGVNFTAEPPAWYAPQRAVAMLDQLRRYGVDSIALVPYGFSARDKPVIRFGNAAERTDAIEDLCALAHQRGMKVMLKPQLWVGRGFAGDIQMSDPRDRAAWFEQYRRFLDYYAAAAARMHADILCVGVELIHMTEHEAEWRKLVARARELYPGPLVYGAAHGPEFERIAFWDALDYIGLNNYYPLADGLSADAAVKNVEAVQQRFKRPVIFTEAGYASLKAPHRAPWDETPRELSLDDQARCYEALFRAFYNRPWFAGVYWWKVGTNGMGGPQDRSHTPWRKPAMEVVGRWYQRGGR